jgi:2-aminobenzoate-CoA ligase
MWGPLRDGPFSGCRTSRGCRKVDAVTQDIPEGYLPDMADLPDQPRNVPELAYPTRLNAAAVLVDGALAAGFGDQVVYYCDDGTVTYTELAAAVDRAGAALRSLGIRPGERVLLRLEDGPELVYWILAAQKVGAVPVPTFTLSRASDLVYRENDTEAVAVVVGADLLGEVDAARPGFRHVRHLIAVPGTDDPGYLNADALRAGSADTGPVPAAATCSDDLALILYTSGSTGEPKGCWHTHADVLAIADTYARHCLRPTIEDVFAGPPPIPFALGFGFFVVFPIRFGAAAVLTSGKSPARMLAAIEEHGVTIITGVSTYFGMLVDEIAGNEAPTRTSSLRMLLCGGEPLPDRIAARCAAEMGLPLVQFLGTTEMLHNIVSYVPGEVPRQGSFGRAVPGYEVVVRDPVSFEEVPRGEAGLLTVRGATGTKYWRKPEQQREAVREGWCVVKDIVRMDPDGYLYYVSRSDEMIISSGYNIAPADVEGVLLRHPSVRQVACVGAPDPTGRRATVVKACIVLRAGHEPSDRLVTELQEFFKANASPHIYPRLIEFLPALPQTPTGKVRRSELAIRRVAPTPPGRA